MSLIEAMLNLGIFEIGLLAQTAKCNTILNVNTASTLTVLNILPACDYINCAHPQKVV
jgi:hypothetical protein